VALVARAWAVRVIILRWDRIRLTRQLKGKGVEERGGKDPGGERCCYWSEAAAFSVSIVDSKSGSKEWESQRGWMVGRSWIFLAAFV
jgi:hypothetical protein